jgi:hypothetical protein
MLSRLPPNVMTLCRPTAGLHTTSAVASPEVVISHIKEDIPLLYAVIHPSLTLEVVEITDTFFGDLIDLPDNRTTLLRACYREGSCIVKTVASEDNLIVDKYSVMTGEHPVVVETLLEGSVDKCVHCTPYVLNKGQKRLTNSIAIK